MKFENLIYSCFFNILNLQEESYNLDANNNNCQRIKED